MFGRRKKARAVVKAVQPVTTNPAVPVAGAVGFAMLGASAIRRRSQAKASKSGTEGR